ncbi:hypothetical protein TNCV_5072941 [Trichonephila clavipes]|nr:hypothetical protein TNCV_5072941 [Trichonephila clavipes]
MSAEVTMIHALRSSTVDIGVSHTCDLWQPQEKKFKGFRSRKRGGQAISPPHSILLPEYVAWRWLPP